MKKNQTKQMKANWIVVIISSLIFLILLEQVFAATPEGPTVTVRGNSSRQSSNGTKVNITGGAGQTTSGGYIFGVDLDVFQTNSKWKAYLGNVTGTLTLDDATGATIYKWPITSTLSGNVYATRASGAITWSNVDCATLAQIEAENRAINHTGNPNDNITATFNSTNHSPFTIGGNSRSNCRSTSTFKSDVAQTQTSADDFQEIVTWDGSNIIYATNLETNAVSYGGGPADFQILIPENGLATWQSSIAYYFYVELQ
jgi:hypothetical protein